MTKLSCIALALIFLQCTTPSTQHRNIAITIDDVPNTAQFQRDEFEHVLLNKLDSLNIPAAIFVNESLVTKTDSVNKNKQLLEAWCKHTNITLGNHTYSHPWYSETPFKTFVAEIEQGEQLMRAHATTDQKELKYFRFPFNDLGSDSLQQTKIDSVLNVKGYISTPFTAESSDWMFSAVYDDYLQNNEMGKARALGQSIC
jgi:peptidoglycan-N-acetylglucosamine deacetylase